VEMSEGVNLTFDQPVIAVSSFGFAEMAAQTALGLLEEAGFIPVICHAQGKGDKAMEEMIRDGMFNGVLDLCPGGITEHLFGGNRDAGPDRLMAAVRRGIPMVLAPCGLDFLSYGGQADKLAATADRRQYTQDSFRIQVRTSTYELLQAADVIAERLNQATGPFTFLIPLRGWSSLNKEGGPMFSPDADAAFVTRLRERLIHKDAIKEVDLHLYTPEFARVAVAEFVRLFRQSQDGSGRNGGGA